MIHAIPSGPFATNAYVVACPQTKKAAIIDPGVDSKKNILTFLEQQKLTPIAIILTHSHWDHIGDVRDLKELLKLPVLIHQSDAPNLENPGADRLPMITPIKGTTPDQFLKEGQNIPIGNLNFKVIETPGHSPGSICLYEEKEHLLLSGDTLFKGSIGNLSFPTSDSNRMWPSLAKLAALPPQTSVYPGHGESTTIGAEKWLPRAQQIFGY